MVMTEAALAALSAALPDSNVDVRRFRPSFVVDTAATPGQRRPRAPGVRLDRRRATIGTATIEFAALCPRCVMVTHEISDQIPADRAVLRHIVRDLDQNLGVYASIVTPGTVSFGDAMTFV